MVGPYMVGLPQAVQAELSGNANEQARSQLPVSPHKTHQVSSGELLFYRRNYYYYHHHFSASQLGAGSVR